jgi:protein-S-isoprenylcysteine O-methyltransferase Ste14
MLLSGWLWPVTLPFRPFVLYAGIVLLIAGVVVSVWGSFAMHRAGTHISPLRPSIVLVTTGPFRLSRNPLYLADTLLILGLAFVLDNPWGLLVLVPILVIRHYGVILREERYLQVQFGEEYRQYCGNVHRYL